MSLEAWWKDDANKAKRALIADKLADLKATAKAVDAKRDAEGQ